MPRQLQAIPANEDVPLRDPGRVVQILSTGAVASINLKVMWSPTNVEDFGAVENTWKFKTDQDFYGIVVRAAAPIILDYVVSSQDVTVTTGRGSAPAFPLYVSGALLGDTPAGAIVEKAPVAVTDAGVLVQLANVNRLEVRVSNAGANPVALGAAGLVFANAANVLQPGDFWLETKAAALELHAICGAGLASMLHIEELTA